MRTPDSAGRLDTVAIPGGLIDYDYYPPASAERRRQDERHPRTVRRGPGLHVRRVAHDEHGVERRRHGQRRVAVQQRLPENPRNRDGATGGASTRVRVRQRQLLTCASPTSCSPAGADALRLTRNPQHGMVTSIALGQTSETWTYNDVRRTGAAESATFSAAPLVDITYDAPGFERDALGRIVRKTEDDRRRHEDLPVHDTTSCDDSTT